MGRNGVAQRRVQRLQRLVFGPAPRAAAGQRGNAPAFDDATGADRKRFAGKHALDGAEHRLAPRRVLQLEQLPYRSRSERGVGEAGGDERLRLGGESEIARSLRVIERLDTERITRQDEPTRRRIVDGDGEHPAQTVGEVEAVAAVKMQRRLAVRARRERGAIEGRTQFEVVVDFGVGDQAGRVGRARVAGDRLVAGFQVDDGETGNGQGQRRARGNARRVGAAMRQRAFEAVENDVVRPAPTRHRHAADAAHQDAALRISRSNRAT